MQVSIIKDLNIVSENSSLSTVLVHIQDGSLKEMVIKQKKT